MSLLQRAMKNSTLEVKLADDRNVANDAPPVDPMINVVVAQAYADVVKDLITHTAFTIGGVFAACKIVERICR